MARPSSRYSTGPQRGGGRDFGRNAQPIKVVRRKGGGGFFSFLFSTIVLLGALGAVGAFAFHAEVSRPGPAAAEKTVLIPRGASAGLIGSTLQREGAVRNGAIFRFASMIYARGETLKAGEYTIAPQASVTDIIREMAEGNALQHAITIPEGYTVAQAFQVIADSEFLTGDMPPAPPEGSIMPETYNVERGMTRTALVQQMRDARDEALAEIWARRGLNAQVTTPEQAVILASIVERETGVPAERPRVASAFTNRLRIHMGLESDPTIIYGVCRQMPARCRNGRLINERTGQIRTIRASEKAQSWGGYNTYRNAGLPPTPISNPGRAALEAVVNPPVTQDLFFVADGTGGHAFAPNMVEHQRNVDRWREIERVRLAQEAANAAATTTTAQPRR